MKNTDYKGNNDETHKHKHLKPKCAHKLQVLRFLAVISAAKISLESHPSEAFSQLH